MKVEEFLSRVRGDDVSRLQESELAELLDAAATVREEDTCVSGMIRVLDMDGCHLLQEQTTKGEILVRVMPSAEAANELVAQRLEIYERMWDGCGCKVNYFDGESPST